MRRPLLFLLIAAFPAAIVALLKEPSPEERLNAEATRLNGQVEQAQAELRRISDDLLDAAHAMDCANSSAGWKIADRHSAQRSAHGIEYAIFCKGDLKAWSGNPVAPVADTATGAFIRNANGCWLHALARSSSGVDVHTLRALWSQPPFENRYLHKHFHPSLHVGTGVVAALDAGLGPVVHDRKGDVLFRLQWASDTPPPGTITWLRLMLLFVCAAFALAALWGWLSSIAIRRGAWLSIGVLLAIITGARWLSLHAGPWPLLSGFPLFDPDLFAASAVLPSLGDLLVTVALLVLLCAFVRKVLRVASTPTRPAVAVLFGLLLLIAFAGWINMVMIALVRDSRITLDLFHVQSLDAHSVIALFAIAFLLFAWLLLADALVRWCAPGLRPRMLSLLAIIAFSAAHAAYHLHGNYDSVLVLWPLPLLLALLLIRRDRPRFTHGLLLVISLSLFTVHVLNRQTFKRQESDRLALAEAASTREDPVIELLFHDARNDIAIDRDANTLIGTDSSRISAAELDLRLRQNFFSGPWNNYDVRLHLFSGSGTLRGSTSPNALPTLDQLRSRFEQGVPVAGDPTLRNVHRPTEDALYIGVIGPIDGPGRGRLIVELLPRVMPEGLGFPELLLAGDRAVDRRSDRYARARYERGALVESSGPFAFPIHWTLPVPGDGLLLQQQGVELLAIGEVGGTLVVLGVSAPTLLDHVTTFSYVFIFFALLGAGFLVLRALFTGRGVPPFDVSAKLRAKLRAGILLFAGIALVLFAFGAQRLLRRNYADHAAQQIDERSRSAIADLRRHVHLEQDIAPNMLRDLDHWIDDASEVLLTDLSLYSPEGMMIATSREQVFTNGLLGPRMDPDAFVAMAIQGKSVFAHEERIGDAVFRAAYRPLLNDRGQVLAYLAVPYFARQSEVEEQRTAGFVAIVNLFVLLFVLSVAAAAIITTWTTRPLLLLKRGLERIALGARNEPIVYQGNDELGDLVRVYNRKVEELRDSAEKLARSERESAWKEMAKQVAHEIKNPLTPMKLGIQHFQRSWDADAPDAKEKLDRFSASMVEQIDALSRVASDFSQFAQMSAANETVLDLNEVAKSAVELFSGEPNVDISLNTSSPLTVKADREHLLRVFNNLIKNALQSIPEGRRGKIDVILRSEGNEAIAEVRDNGSGIPEEARERIFTPSFTTKTSGMGLGLAMVKRMVEQAGGRVWFETRINECTSFFVALPFDQSH